ncbi:MAG TPA: ThuA domain-containing protein [Sphingomonas sp.]
MPTIRYRAPLQVLVAVRGHPFDRTAFDAVFQSMDGIAATMVDQPAAAQLMNPDGMAPYDALVLYDMPGLDFDAPVDKPFPVDPGDTFRRSFEALLESGKGIVALHHALAGWPAWPAYGEALGGTFLYRPATLRGVAKPDSGYRHEVTYTAEVVAPDHPVMAGIPATFEMTDELYLGEVFAEGITPLLHAHHAFVRDGFYSATAAMEGRMFDNEGWSHDEGSNVIGWTRRAANSQVVYLQPGDDSTTYDNPVYRRLVENAIRWVAAPQ